MDEDLTEAGWKPRSKKKVKEKSIRRLRVVTMHQDRKKSEVYLNKQKKLSKTPYFTKSDEVGHQHSAK